MSSVVFITLCVSALIASCVIIAGDDWRSTGGVYTGTLISLVSRGDLLGTAFGVGIAIRMGFTFSKRGSTFCGLFIIGTAPGVLFRVFRRWLRCFRRRICFLVGFDDVVTCGVRSTL